MKYPSISSKRGFTIIELLVVVAIIGILMAIVIASLNVARQKARDAKRLSDLKQIELALEVYFDVHGEFPCENAANCSNPAQIATGNGRIGEGAGIDALLAPYLDVPHDPLGPGNGTYRYYYDGAQLCGDNPNQIVIAAINMEDGDKSNVNDTMCTSWGGEGGIGSTDSYMVIIGRSKG